MQPESRHGRSTDDEATELFDRLVRIETLVHGLRADLIDARDAERGDHQKITRSLVSIESKLDQLMPIADLFTSLRSEIGSDPLSMMDVLRLVMGRGS